MIIDLTDTSTQEIVTKLLDVREEGGAVALGRVLTLVVLADGRDHLEETIEVTNAASREHPARVIVVDTSVEGSGDGVDAQIRVGHDAGASEVVVLRPRGGAASHLDTLVTPLLLPDTPIVATWVGLTPADPAADPIGALAQRRITDLTTAPCEKAGIASLAANYTPGDTDLSWARITLWRALVVSTLGDDWERVESADVHGALSRPSTHLLAGWLGAALDVPVRTIEAGHAPISRVHLHLTDGDVVIDRPDGSTIVTLSRPGAADQHTNLPLRSRSDCLMEDLRRLDADETYARALARAAANMADESWNE